MGELAEIDYRLGRWDAAHTLAEHAISLAEASEQIWVQGYLRAAIAQVSAARGDFDAAEEQLAAARALAQSLGDPATFVVCENTGVHIASCRADPTLVVERAGLLNFLDEGPTVEPGWLSWPVPYVSALVELGRLDEAESALVPFEEVARQRGSRSRQAGLSRVRGELATARRDHQEARECFEHAIELGSSVDALERGIALASYGRFLRRRGERRAAQDRLLAARRHFLELGARPFVARVDGELAASGLPAEPAPPSATTGLTPQERLVASLACKGMSNQEVAHQLVLSVKTVSYHLGNVYTKLDVHSRAQLVARLGLG
jgi:ATP/maltotriose-dependent transcriptional regulator MalT